MTSRRTPRPTTRRTAPPTADPAAGLVCPECGEDAVACPPTHWTAAYGPPPEHSHTDGEPLCPVVGRDGYRPARPTRRRR